MPKLKRTSENQITKDIYERDEEDSRFPDDPDPGHGMERATESQMRNRKIIKVSRSRKFAARSSAPSSTPAATNAFAATKLDAAAPPSNNPFAKVQLQSGTAAPPPFPSTATTLPFSFGAAPTTTPKPFPSSQQPSLKTSSPLPVSKPKSDNSAQIEAINRNFFEIFQDHLRNGFTCQDLSGLMEQYISIAEKFQAVDGDNNDGDVDNDNNDGGDQSGGSSSGNSENNSQPSTSANSFTGFSFASSSSRPASTGTTFSFTGGSAKASAPAAGAGAAPTFSFGTQPVTTSSGSGSNPISNEDDPTSNPDDGKLEIGQEENTDEEVKYEVCARLVKLESGDWKKLGKGTLRLYRNSVTDKKRIVLRNDLGKVMFNVSVSKGMPFTKQSSKTKKGEIWYVNSVAVENEGEEPKPFKLNVTKNDVDRCHEELTKLAA